MKNEYPPDVIALAKQMGISFSTAMIFKKSTKPTMIKKLFG